MLAKQRRQGKRGNILLAMRRPALRAFEFHPAKFEDTFCGQYPDPRAAAVWLPNREMNRSSSER
jgi:hypothetical protein